MDAHVTEWLNLVVRWIHFITGVAWIGASFYFNWLENSLNRIGQREEIAGSLWAVHGGGFYYVEKYKVAPAQIPKTLHWFKYEAYFTWITGFSLLAIVYYMNPHLYLIDPQKVNLSPAVAILTSITTLAVSWVGYDLLCKSCLGKNNTMLAPVGFTLTTVLAYGLCQIFSDRAAFIHVGAIIGTCMVANVFFVIIPSQKALVSAGLEGRPMPAELGKKALQRSLHNNYLTLPVLFIMISNHFPSTYSTKWNWAILAALSFIGAGVRHWFNLKGRGQYNVWILPAATVGMIALAFVTKPVSHKAVAQAAVSFETANAVIQHRCVSCHSAKPIDETFTVAPAGVMFDTPDQIKHWAERIKARAVTLENMPFANKSGMTLEERQTLGAWVDQGAITTP
jgi:uncharacterized membrane protein